MVDEAKLCSLTHSTFEGLKNLLWKGKGMDRSVQGTELEKKKFSLQWFSFFLIHLEKVKCF